MDVRLDALPSDPAALQAIIRAQATALRSRDTLIDRLRAQLAALKRARFGASSEKLDRAIEPLELMLEDGEATLAETALTTPSAEPAEMRDRPARQAPPPHLPREEVRHEPPSVCPDCGSRTLRKRGEDVTEVLEYVHASFRVIRHVRPRYACCDCDAPVQAPTPSLPIERGKPGPELVAHVLCAKYLRSPAALPPVRHIRPRGGRHRPLDHGRLGRPCFGGDGAADRGARRPCLRRRPAARRRHAGAGARPRSRPHPAGPTLGLRPRRPALKPASTTSIAPVGPTALHGFSRPPAGRMSAASSSTSRPPARRRSPKSR